MGRSFNYTGDVDFRLLDELDDILLAVRKEDVTLEFEPLSLSLLELLGRRHVLGACKCSLSTEIPDIGELGEGPMQLTVSVVCIINAHKMLEIEWAECLGESNFEADGLFFCSEFDVESALDKMRGDLPPSLDGSYIELEDVAQACGVKLKNVLDGKVSPRRRKSLQEQSFTEYLLSADGAEPDPVFWGRELGRICNCDRLSGGISGVFFELVVCRTVSDLFVCYCTAKNRLDVVFRQSRGAALNLKCSSACVTAICCRNLRQIPSG